MQRLAQHKILLCGESFDHCRDQLHRFFDLTSLVIYDCIEARKEHSFSGLDDEFAAQLATAEDRNRRTIAELVAELEKNGVQRAGDLTTIAQGYLSKTLHILSHFLDGFIGIDSFFYNLVDDSHWVPAATQEAISKNPGHYWLIHIDCYSASPEEAGLLRM
jgi:hypothetical protein